MEHKAVDLALGILDRIGVLGMISEVRDDFWKTGEISDVSGVTNNGKVRARYSQVEEGARIDARKISLSYSYQEPWIKTGEPIYKQKIGFHREETLFGGGWRESIDGGVYTEPERHKYWTFGHYDEVIGHSPSTIGWGSAHQTAVEIQVQRIKFKSVTKYYGHPKLEYSFIA